MFAGVDYEIINYINEGLLPTPYSRSYNLSEYDELVAQAQANKEAGVTVDTPILLKE